jgi:Transglutaminase-like superfamily
MRLRQLLGELRSFGLRISARWQLLVGSIRRQRPTIESWRLLLFINLIMAFRSSETLRRIVRNQRVSLLSSSDGLSCDELSNAMDLACVFYFKKVKCLQHSAATTLLLRRHGWSATMLTGARILPYEFHAWAQVGDKIVNDKPYMHEIYQVLELC